jgi:tetratricopeptide (TPR) repeat protein
LLGKNLQQYEKAIASYDKAIQIKADFYQVWVRRGWTLAQMGRYQEALDSVDKALQIAPNNRFAREVQTLLLQKIRKIPIILP